MTSAARRTRLAAALATRQSLYLALLVALLVRVAWAAHVPVIPLSDSLAYDILATNVATGVGFTFEPGKATCYFLPGAPFIYAAVYFVFGHGYGPIVALHILVSLAGIVLLWKLTAEWFGGTAAGIAAWIVALWPAQIMFVTILATELLFTFLLLLGLWVWTRDRLNVWLRAVCLGPLLALTALVRPHALLLPAWLALERGVRTRRWASAFGTAGLAALLMLVVLLPWSSRNERLFGQHVLVAANFGVTLWMGNNPQSSGTFMNLPEDVASLQDVQLENELKRRALDYIKSNPWRFLQLSAVRLLKTHAYETINVSWNIHGITQRFGEGMLMPLKLISTGYWYAVLLAALGGLYVLVRRAGLVKAFAHPTLLLWGYFAAVHAVVLSQDRYHFISAPMIAALASLAGASLLALQSRADHAGSA